MFEAESLLVTGGAGFIGSALVRRLIATTGATVANVDRLTYAGSLASLAEAREHTRHGFHRADVADADAMRQVFADARPSSVIHLAAESHVDRSIDGPAAFVRSNVVGTFTLLEAARRHRDSLSAAQAERFRFVHVSTDEVYGAVGPVGVHSEAAAYRPASPYSATKAGSDHLVRAWTATYGLPTVVVQGSNVYGPYQFPEKLVPLSIINALEGARLAVYGRGDHVRDWLHVDDFVEAVLLGLTRGRPGETYLAGGGSERANLAVVERIADLVDAFAPPLADGRPRRALISMVPDRPGHDQRYASDVSKARAELGWVPRTDFDAGLRATVEWYLANREWWAPLRAAYRGERLGVTDRPGPS